MITFLYLLAGVWHATPLLGEACSKHPDTVLRVESNCSCQYHPREQKTIVTESGTIFQTDADIGPGVALDSTTFTADSWACDWPRVRIAKCRQAMALEWVDALETSTSSGAKLIIGGPQ